ncbi:ABC transporter permease [Tautonia marina]|uniref:ABC transporter permease n=1 Tax=Tautonia marina TaxID=2653855 RepID=UPI001375D556|nr:ABC transporter permease [Tautonia marina]
MNQTTVNAISAPPDEVVYSPHQHLGLGWGSLVNTVQELWDSRELVWRLFRRNLIARYRQSVLGYFWAVFPSLIMVVTFSYLNRSQLVPIAATDLPYPLHVLLGMTVWQLFADGLSRGGQSLVSSWSMVTKINFSKESLVLASLGESLLDFAIRLVLLAAMFAWYGIVPAATIVLIPVLMVPLLLLTFGFSLILAPVNGVFRDIANFMPTLLTFGAFLTPVVYPPPTSWPRVLINYANPVSPFVIAFRDLATEGTLSMPGALAWGCLVAVAVFLVGLRVFRQGVARIIERV